jgi:hypothetical protein
VGKSIRNLIWLHDVDPSHFFGAIIEYYFLLDSEHNA